ncbi:MULTISPECIES: hypothetical protein [unclassified Thioalkalivibrio]|uniref:hypothetical protein n=1 Tax=unclassified Thioalkalivibrio TaxID=2621013 RepID=UPI00036590B9|nr:MULTISPECIES: hypothetical protein [unclassified Thioalkalivibrio]
MHYKTLLIVVVTSLFLVVGCRGTAPVHNVSDTTITNAQGERPDAEVMSQAIRDAGARLGWRMEEVEPGVMEGAIRVRDHTAVVEIPYSAGQYRIDYKDSTNLNHTNGEIHPNYNRWIENLDNQIRAELSRR